MKRYDRSRLRREYEYLRGCSEMLSYVILFQPSDDQIENKLDIIKTREEEIIRKLKIINNELNGQN